MVDLSKIYLFRMTHIMNIPHILQFGITHSTSPNANPDFVPIGDGNLITTRSQFLLDNGSLLGDYVPFYFGYRMPMLYVIQYGYNLVNSTQAENIVYCVSSVQKIIDLNLDYVFTDGHAVDSFSSQYSHANINQIDTLLDFNAIKAKYWSNDVDLDLKRRKEAEFLVEGDININAIIGYVTYNQTTKHKLETFGIQENFIHIRPGYYF